ACASASAALHWYGCVKKTGGKYKTNSCKEEGAPNEFEWEKFKEGEKKNALSKGGPFTSKIKVAGINVTVECEKAEAKGSIENPAGGGAGVDTGEVVLKGCKVVLPANQNCKVIEPIVVKAKSELVLVSGKFEDKLIPEGEDFYVLVLEGCKTEALNGTFPITGSASAIFNNANSSAEFTTESTNGLRFGGNMASFTGTVTEEIEGGGALKVQP